MFRNTHLRRLDEFDVFVRDPKAVSILRKVLNADKSSITDILTADTPFGIATNFEAFRLDKNPGDATLHFVRQGKRLTGYLAREGIKKNSHLIDFWKVLVPEAGSDGGQKIPDVVLGRPLIVAPGSICTQSFLAFWVSSEAEANSLYSYIGTKFFRFFVSLRKITQHALRSTYTWVPMQTWTHAWTDGELYRKYDLTESEIDYIETVIKHMKLEEFGNDA